MKKKVIALALGLAAGLMLGACRSMPEEGLGGSSGSGNGQTVKLTLWGPTEQQKMLGEMVEQFKRKMAAAGTRLRSPSLARRTPIRR